MLRSLSPRFFRCTFAFGLILALRLSAATYWNADEAFRPVVEDATYKPASVGTMAYPGGKVLVYGAEVINSRWVGYKTTRLNADGSIDDSFSPTSDVPLAVYPSGKILVGRRTDPNTTAYLISRLNAGGTPDESFTPVTVDYDLIKITWGAAGKFYVTGRFRQVTGAMRNGIARLNADGTVDETFTSPFSTDATINGVAEAADGKVFVVGGALGQGTGRNEVARLDEHGALDATFTVTGTSFPSYPMGVFPNADGSVVIARGTALTRLSATGAYDASFAPSPVGSVISYGDRQPDGRFYYITSSTGRELRRLNADGTPDESFTPLVTPLGSNYPVNLPAVLDDGTLLVGAVTPERLAANNALTRVSVSGAIDESFNPRFSRIGLMSAFARQADGRYVIAGKWSRLNGVATAGALTLARVLADGSTDSSFTATLPENASISQIIALADGKILVFGTFGQNNVFTHVRRFLPTGAEDPSFTPIAWAHSVASVDLLGRIYLIGYPSASLVRYLADGALDASFQYNSVGGAISAVTVAPTGRVWIVQAGTSLVRLTATGAVDAGTTPLSLSTPVGVVALPDGSAFVAERLTAGVNQLAYLRVRRVAVDGSVMFTYTTDVTNSNQVGDEQRLSVLGALYDLIRTTGVTETSSVTMRLADGSGVSQLECGFDGHATYLPAYFASYPAPLTRYQRSATPAPSFAAAPKIISASPSAAVTRSLATSALFSAVVAGLEPLTYEWRRDGVAVGTNRSSYSISNIAASDAGFYSLHVSNAYGSADTPSVQLIVDETHTAARIVANPQNQVAALGGSATFSVTAIGNPAPSYQWYHDNSPIAGATTSTFTVSPVQAESAGFYKVVVSNSFTGPGGSVGSNATGGAVLSITDANHPPTGSFTLSSARTLGETLSIALNIGDPDGNYAFSNLWVRTPKRGWVTIKGENSVVVSGDLSEANNSAYSTGAQTRTFKFTTTDGPGDYTFALAVVDLLGARTNVAAQTITVAAPPNNPPTAALSVSSERTIGQTVTITIDVNDPDDDYAYSNLWARTPGRGWITIRADNTIANSGSLDPANTAATTAGQHARTFTYTPTDGPGDYTFALAVVDAWGARTNASTTVTVLAAPPVITTQPASQTVAAGSPVTFTVAATGTAPFSYQWFKDGTAIAGATSATLTLPYVLARDAGDYSVTVTNAASSASSASAALTISGPAAIVQVATGAYHSLFLRGDGTLWTAGNNTAGQLGDGTTTNRENAVQVATDVRAIYAGWWHSFFLKSDGSLWAMGSNSYGQLGDGTTTSTTQPVQVMTGVVKVATWERRTLFLKTDGTLWVAGSGAMGSVNVFAANPQPTQLMTDVRDMALGEQHLLIVKSNGDLFAAGRNLFGQLGDGTTTDRASLVQVAAGVAAVAAGQEHSAYLKLDGTLWTVGLNDRGQLGTGDKTDRAQAVQIATGVRAVFAGYRRTWFVKTDGTLWRAGATDALFGTAGDAAPVQIAGNPVAMASLLSHSLCLLSDGRVLSAGSNTAGQLADGTFASREATAPVLPGVFVVPGTVSSLSATDATLTGAVRVVWSPAAGAIGYEVWRAATNNSAEATRVAAWVGEVFYYDYTAPAGTSYYWVRALSPAGPGSFGVSDGGSPNMSSSPQITAQPQAVHTYVGQSATLSVTATGAGPLFYQWMKDGVAIPGATQAQLTLTNLQVADSGIYRVAVSNAGGSITSQEATLGVTVLHGVLHVSAGREHTLFLRTDGSLWGTGNSAYGQVPAAQNVFEVTAPVLISNNVVAMAAGWWHTLFVTADGKLYTMGRNNSGQLGDGSTTNRTTPVLIANDVAAVGAGANNSYFIRKDGSLWGMGEGSWSQLGNGSLARQLSPIKLLERAAAVAGGERHAVVLKDDGTVWTAGYFSYGALGTGNSSSSAWNQIATGATAVAAGDNHTLFLKSDGSVWATGDNSFGQLGNGTTAGSGGAAGVFTPFQVTTGIDFIAAGGNTSLLGKTDGTVWAMGTNAGAYGNGTTAASLSPAQIFSGNAVMVSTSGSHTGVAVSDGSLRTTGANSRGQLGNGTQTASNSFLTVATGTLAAPAAPTNVVAFADTSGAGVRVTWSAPVGWSRFEVWRGTTATFGSATQIAPRITLPTYLDTTAQAGTDYYYWVKAANSVGVSAVSAMASSAGAPPVISQSPTNQTVPVGDSATFTVVATGDAPFTYQWRKGGNALSGATNASYTIENAQLADAGSYDVVVTNGFGSVTASAATLTVNKRSQIISFGALPNLTFSAGPLTLTVGASSGLPVTLTVLSGPATLSGNTVTFTAAGTITLRASQAGNQTYLPAADVDRTFTVTKSPATLTLGDLAATYDGAAKSVTATTNPAGLTVVFTYDGSTTAPTNAGSYAIAASIDHVGYQGSASATLTIAKAAQTITFAALADTAFTTTPISLTATSSSNLPVALTVVSGPATLDDNSLTLSGAGTITIRAAQAGNGNYLAAANVERSFTVAMSFAAWQHEHFTADELLDLGISGANADPDADGFGNLVEYALGTDPRAESSTGAPQMSSTAQDWTFTYQRPADRADLAYTVECSTNLTTWSSTGVIHTLVSSSNGIETWRASYPIGSSPTCFFRLVVTH